MTETRTAEQRLADALEAPSASARLQAAMTAGTHPRPPYVPVLIARCRVEPDFSVRETLTWALIRHDPDDTVAPLVAELDSPTAQARSQALHSLSKIGDPRAWPAITEALLTDQNPDVARAAWRTAAGLAPDEAKSRLAATLATQFARGDRSLQQSLTRAFQMLGESASAAVETAAQYPDPQARLHALATAHLIDNPDDDFDTAVAAAHRELARRRAPEAARPRDATEPPDSSDA